MRSRYRSVRGTAVVVACVLALGACARQVATSPPFGISGKELYAFDGLAQMTATTPVVVVGEVTATEPGRTIGVAEQTWRTNVATLEVEKPLQGNAGDQIGVEETGTNGVPYLKVGDRVILFLRPYIGDPPREDGLNYFTVMSSQGRFALSSDETLIPANVESEWLGKMSGLQMKDFLAAFSAAQASAQQGDVTPLPPPPLASGG